MPKRERDEDRQHKKESKSEMAASQMSFLRLDNKSNKQGLV